MKVFISYSSKDRLRAESLFRDLQRAGAEPMQFGKSETFADAAWSQIVQWIHECDAFVVLISATALKSTAVQEEIKIAHHQYINSDRTHPARIVSAIIEKGRRPPLDIDRFPHLDLLDYTLGLGQLVKELGLRLPAAKAAVAAVSQLPDVDVEKAAARFAENRPKGLRKWLDESSKLLSAYQEVKPAKSSSPNEPEHIDSLLASISGKPRTNFATPKTLAPSDSAFLGVDVTKSAKKTTPLSELLLNYDPAQRMKPLDAPVLTFDGTKLRWTKVSGATGYVVERASARRRSFKARRFTAGRAPPIHRSN